MSEDLSLDPILRGRLRIWQPKVGYRFTVDPLLLLDFISHRAQRMKSACDFGTGSGILAVGLAATCPSLKVTAVELQPRLCLAAERTIRENAVEDRVTVLTLDLADRTTTRRLLSPASFDLVVSNPPYRPLGEGPVSPDVEEAIARHELRLTLAQLVAEARRLLRPSGSAAIVYPAARLPALFHQLETVDLRPIRLRLVHQKPGEPATLVLVEAQKGARSLLRVEAPLTLRDESGAYGAEARRVLGEPLGPDQRCPATIK